MSKKNTINTVRILAVIAAILILKPSGLMAQGYFNHHWYFGSAQRDLRFSLTDQSPTIVTNQNGTFGQGGSAVATDPLTGTLLFYTDGQNIYDALHLPMPGGPTPLSPLMGTSAQNQPVAICKIPGEDNRYYVFTRQGNTLRSSIVDMTLAGNAATLNQPPTGAFDPNPANVNAIVAGVPPITEALIIIPHSNNTDFWLIAKEQLTTNYVVLQITATGIALISPPFTPVGGQIQNAASFSYHAATKKIAVAPHETNRNVEVLTFTETAPFFTTQIITDSYVTGATGEAIFDTEFSNSGRYLYVSRHGQTAPTVIEADVIQYNLIEPTLASPASVISNNPARSYGLQMGPDSVIYHLYQQTVGGPFLLGALTDFDNVADETNYDATAFAGNFSGRQFPNFALHGNFNITASFTSSGTCANAPTSFFPTVSPDADSIVWEFGDNATSSSWSPVHTYTQGGNMTVTMNAYVNGQVETVTQQLSITDVETQITLPSDTTACSCELPYTKSTNPPSPPAAPCNPKFTLEAEFSQAPDSWTWYGPAGVKGQGPGSAAATLAPDSAGYYYIIARVGACEVYRGVNIKEYGVPDQRANIWYFGNNAGLDFNPLPDDPVRPTFNNVMNAPEGTSTISDRNGQVVFFTDGRTVWGPRQLPGPTFPLIPNASGVPANLGGDPGSSQAALIVPVPGDETLYYIFTTQEVYGAGYRLSYSLFDRKKGTFGEITQENILLFTRSTERVTASASGWLIAHEYGNNAFRAYQITQQGIGNPVVSGVGSDHTFAQAQAGQGYMKLSPNNVLGVTLSIPPANTVELFDFVDSTGVVTNYRVATLATDPSRQVYGLEFVNDRMFVTLSGSSSLLYEFYIDSLGRPHEFTQESPPAPNTNKQSQTVINAKLGAIQVGPDGQVYVAVDGAGALGTIQVTADTTRLSLFTLAGQQLVSSPTTTSTLGLPNFVQSISEPPMTPSMNIAGFCFGEETVFTGSGTDNIDILTWFIDGVMVGTPGPDNTEIRQVLSLGAHTVRLLIENRCKATPVADFTRNFTIVAPPQAPLTPQTLCRPPLVLDANPKPEAGLTYEWSTGATSQTINVFRVGTYSVNITSTVTGCNTEADIEVLPGIRQVDLGNDITTCANAINTTLNTFYAPSVVHKWYINTIEQGNTSPEQAVDVTAPGTFTYIVVIDEPNSGCLTSDTVTYTVNRLPVATLLTPSAIICGASNGQIDLSITQPAGSTVNYLVSNSQNVVIETATNVPVAFNKSFTGLPAGTYDVVVTDPLTTCVGNAAVTISTNSFLVSTPDTEVCAPEGDIDIVVAPDASPLPSPLNINYILTNTATGDVSSGQVNNSLPTFPVTLSPGSYTINVLINGCSAGATLNLAQAAPVANTALNVELCTTPATAEALPTGFEYTWSGPVSATSLPAVNITGAGTVQVIISDPADVLCPVTLTRAVDPTPMPAPDLDFNQCETPPTLVAAAPIGADYNYIWRDADNGNAVIGNGQRLALPASFAPGTRVALFVQNSVTGCSETTSAVPITPAIPFTINITFPEGPPCENSTFTLVATPTIPDTGMRYRWFFQDTNSLPISDSFEAVGSEDGLYIVQVTDGFDCTRSAEYDPELIPTDPGDLADRGYICPYPQAPEEYRDIELRPGDYENYTWYTVVNGTKTEIPGTSGIDFYTATAPGSYLVELLDNKNCTVIDEIEVIEECEPVVTGPTAFRPSSAIQQDGEMVNQSFRLYSYFIDDDGFSIYIFNRWGEMIYASNEREFRWNGGYKNNLAQLVPAGTYSYVVRYKSRYRPEDGLKEKRGSVVLVR